MEAQLEQCVIIKFLDIKGSTADEISTRLLPFYGEAIYAPVTIYE
jgi:hypothetical protein